MPEQLPEDAEVYLSQTRMKDKAGTALLVDPGAHGDLTSDGWVSEYNLAAQQAGRPNAEIWQMKKPLEVGGVGKHSQRAHEEAHLNMGIQGQEMEYVAPMLRDSKIPGLLGIGSLRRMRALVDCWNDRLFLVGQGGYKLQLSPGSRNLELQQSNSGHLMLPCTDWPSNGGERGSQRRASSVPPQSE